MPVNGMREGPAPLPCPKCGAEPRTVGVTWNGWTDTSCACLPGFIGGGHGTSASIRDWNFKVNAKAAAERKKELAADIGRIWSAWYASHSTLDVSQKCR